MTKSKLTFLFTLAIAVSFLTAITASAQGVLRNQNRYSKRDVSTIIMTLENSSDAFRRDFDRAMDQSNLNGTNAEDRFNNNVRDYENSLDSLRRQFDRTDSWWTTRNEVSSVMQRSQTVNTMMNTLPFRRNLERQWTKMRNDLNKLADTYDLPGLNGGGWNGGNNGGGWNGGGNSGNMSRPPSWAVGTFYSQDGSNITLTIGNNGYITAIVDGQSYNGTYFRGSMLLNGDTSTISQWGNGIRTFNRQQNKYTNYGRNAWGGGGNNGGGWNDGGNTSRPPSWARGTFYSTNGPSNISLTIQDSGRVTAVVDGQTYYGTYYNGNLVLNGDSSTISKNGNGIRTYNRNTGQYTNYRR